MSSTRYNPWSAPHFKCSFLFHGTRFVSQVCNHSRLQSTRAPLLRLWGAEESPTLRQTPLVPKQDTWPKWHMWPGGPVYLTIREPDLPFRTSPENDNICSPQLLLLLLLLETDVFVFGAMLASCGCPQWRQGVWKDTKNGCPYHSCTSPRIELAKFNDFCWREDCFINDLSPDNQLALSAVYGQKWPWNF